jgi:hypothetical protein
MRLLTKLIICEIPRKIPVWKKPIPEMYCPYMHRVSTGLLYSYFLFLHCCIDGLQMLFMFMHICGATDTNVLSNLYSIELEKGRPQSY